MRWSNIVVGLSRFALQVVQHPRLALGGDEVDGDRMGLPNLHDRRTAW